MRSSWISTLGLLIWTTYNAPAHAYQTRNVLPRAGSQPSAISEITTQPGSSPTKNADSVSSSPQASSGASKASVLSGSTQGTSSVTAALATSSSAKDQKPAASTSDSSSMGTATSTAATSTTSATNGHDVTLPITPTITPGLSVAGAILILTGLFYTLIGIKTRWLHTFLSTAYLVGLAITVLIIYVLHPPVSYAVQGAYVVAAVATGILLGGGSVIFADLTEGLACLLGGFCLSMWFLELRPDGLIRSTIGKSVFIGVLTLGAYGFYAFHFTRPYGLIGSISLSGATAIVLGIDCFSRAGLKEFWVCIWNLNNSILPPHYKGPFPVTRGIRVEIAATVLLSLVGVISQLKVWKIVKQQKDRKAAVRMEEEQRQEQVELDIGKGLTIGNEQERAAWEKIYGDQAYVKVPKVDSGVGTVTTPTPRRASLSGNEAEEDGPPSMESADKAKTQQPPTVTVRVASEDSIYELSSPPAENLLLSRSDNPEKSTTGSLEEVPEGHSKAATSLTLDQATCHSLNDNFAGDVASPPVVPLPFKVDSGESSHEDDRSSVATFAASDRLSTSISKRLSNLSLTQHLPKTSRRQSTLSEAAEAGSVVPDIDDRASSIVTSFDIGAASRSERDGLDPGQPSSPSEDAAGEDPSSEPLIPGASLPLTFQNLKGDDPENLEISGAMSREHTDPGSVQEPGISRSLSRLSSQSIREMNMSRTAAAETTEDCASPTSLRDQLPEGASRVMMTYRTNEWAKHLEQAEAPSPEILRRPSRGPDSAPGMTEGAAPVNVQQLQQTAFTAAPAFIRINTDLARSAHSSRDSLPSQQQRQSSLPSGSSLQRSSQGRPMNRTSSQISIQNPRATRRASAPLMNSPLAGSPIEEGVEMSFPQRGTRTPSGMRPNTLMAQRDSILQSKHSSTSLARTSSSSSLGPTSPLEGQHSAYTSFPTQRPAHQVRQRASRPHLTPRTSGSHSPYHQTLSGPSPSTANRENTASAWRSSLSNDVTKNLLSQQQMEAKRNELLEQKRRASAGAQAAGAEVARRENQRGEGMRRADMMERHKEAMKKLQAGVEL